MFVDHKGEAGFSSRWIGLDSKSLRRAWQRAVHLYLGTLFTSFFAVYLGSKLSPKTWNLSSDELYCFNMRLPLKCCFVVLLDRTLDVQDAQDVNTFTFKLIESNFHWRGEKTVWHTGGDITAVTTVLCIENCVSPISKTTRLCGLNRV